MARTGRIVCTALLCLMSPRANVADDSALARADRATTAPSALERALRALDDGDVDAAKAALNDRDAAFSDAERHLIRGRISLLELRWPAARRDLQAAVRAAPKRSETHYWLGRVYQADGAHALASTCYQEAFALGMGTCDLHLHWARALRDSGSALGGVLRMEWRERFEEAPRTADFLPEGIVVGAVRGRSDVVIVAPKNSAVYQMHKAISIDPSRSDALIEAGELWASIDQHELAIIHYRRAAKRLGAARSAAAGAALARCHGLWAESALALGRLDAYLDHTRTQMQLSGGTDSAQLADCYGKAAAEASARGELQRQIRFLTFAVELQPTPARFIALADALMLANRPADAQTYLSRALESHPSRAERAQIRSRLARASYLASPNDR